MSSHVLLEGATHALGPWQDGQATPVHLGVYKRRWPAGPYSCWDGERWYGDARTPAAAATSEEPSPHAQAAWQGLARPAEPCATCRGHSVIDRGYDEESGRDLIAECPDC